MTTRSRRFWNLLTPPMVTRRCAYIALLVVAAALSTACGAEQPASPTPQPTVPPGVTPTPPIEPTPTEAVVALTVWLPESLAPGNDEEGGRLLAARLDEFDAEQDEVTLNAFAKKDTGRGGLLDLLRAASPVAPAVLPDVILLSDADLAVAAREGLIQPLDELLDAESESELFAFARTAARIDGKRMGLPLVADIHHLVYVTDSVEAPSVSWTDLISDSIAYPFAFADGASVGDVVLADYASLGGTIIDAEGQPALTLDALTRLLTLYRDARIAGVVAASNLDWASDDAAWDAFQSSGAPFTAARASRYRRARALAEGLRHARPPSIEGRHAPPVGRSWNLAVVARDPRKQALAVDLIEHLSEREFVAAWTQGEHVLPADAGALSLWNQGDDYVAFARGELSRALPPPSPAALEAVSPAFLGAVRDVLLSRASPQTAAAAAVDAVANGLR